jgi:two-component system chemotaxis response regulator CheB
MTPPLRALLVEDSTLQAKALTRMLEAEGDIVVVATAGDAADAVSAVARHRPDVVTMDLDIPGGGGQVAITQIMAATPTPILVVSGILDDRHAPPAVAALAAGAVEALPKPRAWGDDDAAELRRQVRRVSRIPVIRRRPQAPRAPRRLWRPDPSVPTDGPIVALAASTGGPAALAVLLGGLREARAPVLLVQHIHPSFAGGFAAWLTSCTGKPAVIAENGMPLEAGRVHVAPGDVHLRLAPGGRLAVSPDPPALHRPSADVLFESVAEVAGRSAIGVLLTGMGDDGARGLLAMRRAGARTFAQDEASSTVFGMPRAAALAGAADTVLALDELAAAVHEAVEQAR